MKVTPGLILAAAVAACAVFLSTCLASLASGATVEQLVAAHYAPYQGSPTVRYLSLEAVPKQDRLAWHNALIFSVESASRSVSIESSRPRRVPGTMTYWIDLARLKWGVQDFNKVLERYPYGQNDPRDPLLIIRGDWLVVELADPRDSDALYRLLYGGANIPKTDVDFLRFWGVDPNNQSLQRFGWVETDSQVNKQGTRFIERFVSEEGHSVWRTKDAFFVTGDTDPLEALDGTNKHNGRELIAQFTKVSGRAGKRILGAAQAYLLANGQGQVVQEAPVRLVEDRKRTFGQAAIVTHGSCIVCHEKGMNLPSENGLEQILKAGVGLHIRDGRRLEKLEAFHLTDVGRQLARDNEDYAEYVLACNGLTPEDNAKNFKSVIDQYLKPLALKDVARELGTSVERIKKHLAAAGAGNIDTGSRLSWLAYNRPMPRDQWEDDFLKVRALVRGVPVPQFVPLAKTLPRTVGRAEPERHRKASPRPHVQMQHIANNNVKSLRAARRYRPEGSAMLSARGGYRGTIMLVAPPDAVVTFDGARMATMGARRRFVTKPVPAGWNHTYVVTARAVRGGRWVEQSRYVQVAADQITNVHFAF